MTAKLNKEKCMNNPNKERIIQFGEGGFLRGFFDWMLKKMNDSGVFSGKAVIVQPIEKGMCAALNEQGRVYNHIIRGKEGVEKTRIDVVSRCINPYYDFDKYLALAKCESIRFIVSNTTEAGIVFNKDDRPENAPYISFPAKLTMLLKVRGKTERMYYSICRYMGIRSRLYQLAERGERLLFDFGGQNKHRLSVRRRIVRRISRRQTSERFRILSLVGDRKR